jgi:hypothetical protein
MRSWPPRRVYRAVPITLNREVEFRATSRPTLGKLYSRDSSELRENSRRLRDGGPGQRAQSTLPLPSRKTDGSINGGRRRVHYDGAVEERIPNGRASSSAESLVPEGRKIAGAALRRFLPPASERALAFQGESGRSFGVVLSGPTASRLLTRRGAFVRSRLFPPDDGVAPDNRVSTCLPAAPDDRVSPNDGTTPDNRIRICLAATPDD